jgi:hypothetical protein
MRAPARWTSTRTRRVRIVSLFPEARPPWGRSHEDAPTSKAGVNGAGAHNAWRTNMNYSLACWPARDARTKHFNFQCAARRPVRTHTRGQKVPNLKMVMTSRRSLIRVLCASGVSNTSARVSPTIMGALMPLFVNLRAQSGPISSVVKGKIEWPSSYDHVYKTGTKKYEETAHPQNLPGCVPSGSPQIHHHLRRVV